MIDMELHTAEICKILKPQILKKLKTQTQT